MPGPLDGDRIVDLITMISGPMVAGLLGDQGAESTSTSTSTSGLKKIVPPSNGSTQSRPLMPRPCPYRM